MRTVNLERLDYFQRLAAHAEARRNAALSEIAKHRQALANLLRKTSDEIIQAEFEEVVPAEVGNNDDQVSSGDDSDEHADDHADPEEGEEQAGR